MIFDNSSTTQLISLFFLLFYFKAACYLNSLETVIVMILPIMYIVVLMEEIVVDLLALTMITVQSVNVLQE